MHLLTRDISTNFTLSKTITDSSTITISGGHRHTHYLQCIRNC